MHKCREVSDTPLVCQLELTDASPLAQQTKHKKIAPQVGLEPTTDRLTADSSTTELLWNKNKIISLAASYSCGTSVQLPSALESLTTVFDMGTGVASPPSPPDYC